MVDLGQLGKTSSQLPIPDDGGTIEFERAPTNVPAFQTCPAHTGTNALDD